MEIVQVALQGSGGGGEEEGERGKVRCQSSCIPCRVVLPLHMHARMLRDGWRPSMRPSLPQCCWEPHAQHCLSTCGHAPSAIAPW